MSEQVSANTTIETRRTFLQKTATAAAAITGAPLLQSSLWSQQAPSTGVLGANSRINVAYIGTGSQGTFHIKSQQGIAKAANIFQAAVCDVYQPRLERARDLAKLTAKDAYRDYHEILARKDIDAVVIATVDNWHGPISVDAAKAGKHVFCEKPMTRYLAEAFGVYDAVKASGVTYIIGSQGSLDGKWHKCAEWVKSGKMGPLVWGQGSYCRNNPRNSEWTYPVDPKATEANLDWKTWLGRAPKIPFSPERYFSWHKYYDYNSGILGNLLPHRFQPLMVATGNPEFPHRVVCTGTRKVSTDREITDTTHVLAEYPSGLTLVLAGTTVNEQGLPDILRGRKATVRFASSQNKAELTPEAIFSDELDAETFSDGKPTERIDALEQHFFDCIRNRKPTVANEDLAVRAQTTLCLAEQSERMGMTLYFDAATRQIKTHDGKTVAPLDYETVVTPAAVS